MTERKVKLAPTKPLYPTEKEKQAYRELKDEHGVRDALVVKGQSSNDASKQHQVARVRR